MSRPEEQLACSIARHHFGPIAGEVVRLLLLQPGSTTALLLKDAELFFEKRYEGRAAASTATSSFQIVAPSKSDRPRLLKDALAVLLQHDLVHARQVGSARVAFEYYVYIDKLMCRSRIPLYIGFARQRFGEVGDLALRTLFHKGRLTAHMLFDFALNAAIDRLGLSVTDAEACLADMARAGMLHWSCSRFKRRRRKNRSNDDVAPVGAKRKRPSAKDDASKRSITLGELDSESESESDEGDESDSSMEDGDGQIVIGRGERRRKVGAPTRDNDADVWTVSYWHLNREFRNECCVKVAQMRILAACAMEPGPSAAAKMEDAAPTITKGEVACAILRVGLQLALEQEDWAHPSEDFETGDIDIEDIQRILEERDENLSNSVFWEGLQALIQQTPVFVVPVPEHAPTKMRFVPGRLIAEARQKTLEEYIGTRYQPAGRRVFQALALDGGMEEKMLADRCMMHVKVVRALVYKLYEDDLVSLQEVSRSAHDAQRASNWYYLWHVNLMNALRNVVQLMYRTSYNLFVRLESLDAAEELRHGTRSICTTTTATTTTTTTTSNSAVPPLRAADAEPHNQPNGNNSQTSGMNGNATVTKTSPNASVNNSYNNNNNASSKSDDGIRSKIQGERRNLIAQRMILIGNILRLDQSIMVMRDFGPLTASYFPSKYTMIDGPVGVVMKRR